MIKSYKKTLHFSCAPAWEDPDSASYIIYLLVIGWALPNIIIIGSAIEILRYQKKVYLKCFVLRTLFVTILIIILVLPK